MPARRWLWMSLLLLSPVGFSEETPALAWQTLRQDAVASSAELASAEATLRAAEADVGGARGGFLPRVTGNVTATDTETPSATPSTTTSRSVGVTASQNLFAGFRDRATLTQARANYEVAAANYAIARARVSYDLKATAASLRFASESRGLSAEIVRRREENLRLVELRFESGRENRGSVLLSRAALAQARYELLQAEQNLNIAWRQLARVTGRDPERPQSFNEPVPVSPPPKTVDIAALVHDTPEYRRTRMQKEAAEAGIRIARAGYWPSLDLSGSVNRTDPDWVPQTRSNTVTLGLTVPILNGGRDYYATRAATARAEAATANLETSERELQASLAQAYAGFVAAVAKLAVDEEFAAAAQLRAEIARSKYNNGLLSFENWDIIENDLIVRQRALLASRRDRVIAEAAWQQAIGQSDLP